MDGQALDGITAVQRRTKEYPLLHQRSKTPLESSSPDTSSVCDSECFPPTPLSLHPTPLSLQVRVPAPPSAPSCLPPHLRGPRGDERRGARGNLIPLLRGPRAAARQSGRLQYRAADGGDGAQLLRVLRVPRHQLLRGLLTLRLARGPQVPRGPRARSGAARAAGRGALARQQQRD